MQEESKKNTENESRRCFIITPIGNKDSDIRRKMEGVIQSVIRPALEMIGFDGDKVITSSDINQSGSITRQIIDHIVNDDLVIANLTGNNPNVMYELCLRHVVAKPLINICEEDTVLPFDIKDNRTIFFQDDMLGVNELQKKIIEMLVEIDYEKEYKDNPVYNAIKRDNLLKQSYKSDDGNIEIKLLQEILSAIEKDSKPNVVFERIPYEYDIEIINDISEDNVQNFIKETAGKISVMRKRNRLYIRIHNAEDMEFVKKQMYENNIQYNQVF